MAERHIARVTGITALACVALTWLQFPLWVIGGAPSVCDGSDYARHLLDGTAFYNPGGWGPAIIANFPPLIWFLVVGIVLIRNSRAHVARPGLVAAQSVGHS